MTNNHGEMPIDAESNWTKVTAYAAKNKELQAHRSKEKEESNQIGAQEEKNEGSGTKTNAPRRIDSNYVTRINFKVIPEKNSKTLSVFNSIRRILAAARETDPSARIVATDKDGNETTFTGERTHGFPLNEEDIRTFTNQFVEEPRMTARNELVGLITMRSNTNFRAIKKSPAVQQGLNEQPRIFLTPNYLSVVTPVLVGFFINHYPRPDMPETFQTRIDDFIRSYDPEIQYQVDYGPIWARSRKMSVFKVMTSLANKESLRTIMGYYENIENEDEYVCATEFFSLSDEEKVKMIMHQVEFCTNNKSIFIHGIKDIQVPLRIDANDQDKEGHELLVDWIHRRPTSYGNKMFSRVYQASNGTVELLTKVEYHKDAIDWARLSTSEIAKELNDESMKAVFKNVQDAMDKMAVQPDWKPHTLGNRIQSLKEPATIKKQVKRRQVAISYGVENTTEDKKKTQTSNQKWNDKTKTLQEEKANAKAAEEQRGETKANPITPNKWNPPENTITATATTQGDECDEATNKNIPKFGHNKYKAAAALQASKMQKLEEGMENMLKLQRESKEEFKTFKDETVQRVTECVAAINTHTAQAKKDKKDTDNKLAQFRKSLALFDSMMAQSQQEQESPPRKISRPTLPPEGDHMETTEDDDDDSYATINSQNQAPRSDDEMNAVAGGN
jgi:hypothetical protein